MAEENKSLFKKPPRSAPVIGQNADAFVRGAEATAETTRAEESAPRTPVRQVTKEEPAKEKDKRLTIDIPASLHKRVKTRCADQGTTIADVVRAFLEKSFPAES